jgi:hypothetical protein
MNIPMNKKKRRTPGTQESAMSSGLPNLSGSSATQGAETLTNSPASEEWNEAYKQLFDRY